MPLQFRSLLIVEAVLRAVVLGCAHRLEHRLLLNVGRGLACRGFVDPGTSVQTIGDRQSEAVHYGRSQVDTGELKAVSFQAVVTKIPITVKLTEEAA